MSAVARRVAYIHQENLKTSADALPSNIGRSSLVHSLIKSLNLLETDDEEDEEDEEKVDALKAVKEVLKQARARVVESKPADRAQLSAFHDNSYLNQLLGQDPDMSVSSGSGSDSDSDQPSPTKRRKTNSNSEFGLSDDCPPFEGLSNYVTEVAGASIQAARELRDGRADVAISWNGGRHHARRSEASGFCYVQDIVLSILELRAAPRWSSNSSIPKPPKLSRILYLDLDLHHGDGVEFAFLSTPSVLTLSLHLHAPYFFPSTGALTSTGPKDSNSSYHALNLALHPGLSSPTLLRLYESCIQPILEFYNPDAIVVQCGADGLAGDPCAEWNLGLEGVAEVLKRVVERGKKTLLLGGGGYLNPNAARCWSYLTAIALGRTDINVETEIPTEIEEYEVFKPSFTLDVPMGNMRDQNSEGKLVEVENAFKQYVEELGKKYCHS